MLIRYAGECACDQDRCLPRLDTRKIAAELGWRPQVAFEDGLRQTVEWYLAEISDGGFSR